MEQSSHNDINPTSEASQLQSGVRPTDTHNDEVLLSTEELYQQSQIFEASDLNGSPLAQAHHPEVQQDIIDLFYAPPPFLYVDPKRVEDWDYKTWYWKDNIRRYVVGGKVLREGASTVFAAGRFGESAGGGGTQVEMMEPLQRKPLKIKLVKSRPTEAESNKQKGSAQNALISSMRGGDDVSNQKRKGSATGAVISSLSGDAIEPAKRRRVMFAPSPKQDGLQTDDMDEFIRDAAPEALQPATMPSSDSAVSAAFPLQPHAPLPPNPYTAPVAPMTQAPPPMLSLSHISDLADVPPEIKQLVINLRTARRRRETGFPSHTTLRKETCFYRHFDRGMGRLRPASRLREWVGDTRLFDEEWWRFLTSD